MSESSVSADAKTPAAHIDMALLKREVDALQIMVLSQHTPWYRNISTLLSIVALLFSFGTTFVSYVRTRSQDVQSARVELRGLLQRLTALPKENAELSVKYPGEPVIAATVGGLLNQENAMLARQAAEIASRLPNEYVTSTEHIAIATAMQASYNAEGALAEADRAVETSKDLNDRVGALRLRAGFRFLSGHPQDGRSDLERALKVFGEFKDVYADFTKRQTHVWTELAWATAEAALGDVATGLTHVAAAEAYVTVLPASPGADELRRHINKIREQLERAQKGTIPVGAPAVPRTL